MATAGHADRVERYEPFFGLTEAPFSLAPDPRFLFASASLSAALEQLAYALDRREPLVVITGEIGTGKTLLCRAVLQRLQRRTFLSVINDPLLERDDLLKQMLQDFGVITKDRTKLTETSRHELIQTLHALLRSLGAIQAHAVIIIDEAQHLKPDVLEQIRLLSNIDDERGTLLQIILVGQPELELLLSRPELRQLQQRVSRRFRLEPLNRDEVHQYIDHRLALARDGHVPSRAPGATELANALAEWSGTTAAVEFTADALHAVSEFSDGLPRVINLLCDRSLEEACASRLRTIDLPLIEMAARALGVGQKVAPSSASSFWPLSRSESEAPNKTVPLADDAVPIGSDARARPAEAPRLTRYVPLAGSGALAGAVAFWFGVRAMGPSVAQPRRSAAAPASSATRATSTRSDPVPAGATASVPEAATTTGTPTTLKATAPAPAPTATGDRFEILVASFRTDARATSVAAEVAALGLPIRRRVLDGWQQVVSGPFASRTDADGAQQRLHRAGLGGTQIVQTPR